MFSRTKQTIKASESQDHLHILKGYTKEISLRTTDENRHLQNSIDPDGMVHNEPSHQCLQCLPFCLDFLLFFFASVRLFLVSTHNVRFCDEI